MKPTDEIINQALQKALKKRFDSFKIQPSDRLSSEVLGAIKQSNSSNFKRFSSILILILTCSIGTFIVLKFRSVAENYNNHKSNSVEAKISTSTSSTTLQTGNQTKIKQAGLPEKLQVRRSGKAIHDLTNPKSIKLKHIHARPILLHAGTKKPLNQPRSEISQSTQNSDPSPYPIANKATGSASILEAEISHLTGFNHAILIKSINETPSARLNLDVKKLQPHQPHTKNRTISTPTLETLAQNPSIEVPQASPSHWQGVISFTPTNTYQRLTVLPQMHVQYQNFELPSLFSVQTAGFNLRGGVEKNAFQILVNYSRFTQRIAYEVALDEYLVQPQSSSAYTIVREGSSRIEEITFQLIGLSLQKKFFIHSRSLSGLYAYTGASLSHDLTTSHNLAWGTVGIGKSWPVAPAASLSLIPQMSFGLNTVKTNNDAFKNRFYQLGLAVELTFGKN